MRISKLSIMPFFRLTAKYHLTGVAIVLLTTVLLSCITNAQSSLTSQKKYVYTFETDSVNRNEIGLVRYEDGSVEFPNSIYRYDNYIYVLDQVHSNVKAVDIRNGKVKTSPPIRTKMRLNDLVVWDRSVFVVGDTTVLYKLDLELLRVESLLPGMMSGLKRFLIDGDDLLIYRQHEDVQQNSVDHSVEISACHLVGEVTCVTETKAVGKGYNEYFAFLKPYKEIKDTSCITADSREYCLESPIPNFDFYNLIRPVHIDQESVSFIECIGRQARITCYKF